jgi:hypothetical protein
VLSNERERGSRFLFVSIFKAVRLADLATKWILHPEERENLKYQAQK